MVKLQEFVNNKLEKVVNAGADRCAVTFQTPIKDNDVQKKITRMQKRRREPFPYGPQPLNEIKKFRKGRIQPGEIRRYWITGLSDSKGAALSRYYFEDKMGWKLDFSGSLTVYDKYLIRKVLISLFGTSIFDEIADTGVVTKVEEFIDVAGLCAKDIVAEAKYLKQRSAYVCTDVFVTSFRVGDHALGFYNKHREMQDKRRKYVESWHGRPYHPLLRIEHDDTSRVALKDYHNLKNPFGGLTLYDLRILDKSPEWDPGYNGSLILYGIDGFLKQYKYRNHSARVNQLREILQAAQAHHILQQVTGDARKWVREAFDFLLSDASIYNKKPTKKCDYYRHYGFVSPWLIELSSCDGAWTQAQYKLLGLPASILPEHLLALPMEKNIAFELIRLSPD